MSRFARLSIAFVLLFAAGTRTLDLVVARAELAALREGRTAADERLKALRVMRDSIVADPLLAAAIAARWERGELVLP